MDRQVADLLHLYQNHLGYQTGQRLGGQYSLAAFTADGLHVSDSVRYAGPDGMQFALGAGISYLRGQSLKMQTADGAVAVVGPQEFSYVAQMQESRDSHSGGNGGYAADAGAVLSWRGGAQVRLAVNDLAGQIHWRNVVTQQDSANSVTVNGSPRAQKDTPPGRV